MAGEKKTHTGDLRNILYCTKHRCCHLMPQPRQKPLLTGTIDTLMWPLFKEDINLDGNTAFPAGVRKPPEELAQYVTRKLNLILLCSLMILLGIRGEKTTP